MNLKHLFQNLALVICCCFSANIFAQDKAVIDSVEQAFAKAKTDSVKAAILSDLFDLYIFDDVEKSKSYNEQQFKLAEKSKDDYVYSEAYYTKSYYYLYIGNYDSSLVNMKRALAYAEKSGSPKMLVITNLQLGGIYNRLYKGDSALIYIDKSIELSKNFGDNVSYANAYYAKAEYFYAQAKMDEALQNYLVADSVQSKFAEQKPNLVITLIAISAIYIELKDYDKAEHYALRAKKAAEETELHRHVIESESMLAHIAYQRKDYKVAEEKFSKILEYHVTFKNKSREADVLWMLGKIKLEQNKLGQAKKYNNEALEIRKTLGNPMNIFLSLGELGYLYKKEKNYAESQKYYTEALEISRNIAYLQGEAGSLKNLAELNFETQNYKAASEYYKEYIPLQDSLTKNINFEKTQELETRYQTEQKQQQIELLSAENQLAKQKRRNQFALFTTIIGLLAAGGFAWWYYNRNKLKTAAKIKELNEIKSRFFANISHEFRTPLTLIKSPLQSLQSTIDDESQQEQLSLIDNNSDRMLELVNQLLELSKLDSGKLALLLKAGNVGLFLKSITEPFAYRAKEKGLQFSSAIEDTQTEYLYDKDVIEKIVTNLLSNAVKYTPENNEINVTSKVENETLQLKVSNSGTTLQPKDLPKLFERFHQNNEQNEGFGIGLALVKELVALYKGNIDTAVNDGVLSFTVALPLIKTESESVVIHKDAATAETIPQPETTSDNELPVLLIVDDNAEIRSVVRSIFAGSHLVLEAEDGVAALKLAQKEIPDCIISDVMMPKMDGFEFTRAIKANELTSFIPVILLTAKTSDEARLESLRNEADAFLTKPFNNDVLQESVRQLLHERKKLQERYSRELILKPVDIVINSVDEQFLEKLAQVMESHLPNPDFTTDEFASELAMSRMQLHRKLKSLLNVSTTEFIRNERLKAAAELMKKGNKYIAEIAYAVGFNDVSYFSKCFKEVYKVTPSEYIDNIK